MNTRKHGISATAALIAAASMGIAASTASADPTFLDAEITTVSGTGFTEVITFTDHEFGTTETSPEFFPLTIISGPSDRQGWDYEVTIDYIDYDIGFFGEGDSTIVLSGIKDPDSAFPINAAHAKDFFGNDIGTIEFDAGSIIWNGLAADILAGGEAVTIQWTQIPTPGALALFGVAGLAAARRRRA